MNEVGGEWFSYGGSAPGMQQIDPILATMPITPVDPSIRKGRNANDHQLYIYTSGTTGNPKAGVITSLRFFGVGAGFAETFSVHTLDRIYCCLPLYHSAGGMAGLGMAWYTGGCFVFRSKFSKSNFWSDVGEHRCTVVQYIGELCRYLLTAPESADDRKFVDASRCALSRPLSLHEHTCPHSRSLSLSSCYLFSCCLFLFDLTSVCPGTRCALPLVTASAKTFGPASRSASTFP